MQYEFKDNRLYLLRTDEELAPIVSRLTKIEGQIRGIRQTIKDDRYCGDEIQQANAVLSAIREVAVLIISQHMAESVKCAAEYADDSAPREEMLYLLRTAMRL